MNSQYTYYDADPHSAYTGEQVNIIYEILRQSKDREVVGFQVSLTRNPNISYTILAEYLDINY